MSHLLKSFVLILMIVLVMPFTSEAELHDNVVTINHTDYVNIDRTIVRGGKIYPLYYTSKDDLYAYTYGDIACEMRELYFDEIVKTLEERHDMIATVYKDLRVTIFETKDPMITEGIYKIIKNNFVFDFCQINGVTQHPDMGWPLVVKIPGEESPIGNDLYWWTKW